MQALLGTLGAARDVHLGYPYNLQPIPQALVPFMSLSLNNLGDSFYPSRYGLNTHELEREVVAWFAELWGGDSRSTWGTVTSSGTESNLLGMLYGREACGPDAVVLTSTEAHYSVAKAARAFRMPLKEIASRDAEINYNLLREALADIRERDRKTGVVLVLNAGSTVLGGHDRLCKALEVAREANFPRSQLYVHIDAALSGLITPLLPDAQAGEFAFGFHQGADSIAVSGHKQLGTAQPCGILCCRAEHMERWADGTPESAMYVTRRDSTLSGSRNGFAALSIWHALQSQGKEQLARNAATCIARAREFAARLALAAPWSQARMYCPLSTTVVFALPCTRIADKYQLACTETLAHIVVTPSVRNETLDEFLTEYASP